MDAVLNYPAASARPSTTRWAARIVTAVPVLFLGFDTVIKLLNIAPVVDSMRSLGWPEGWGPVLGLIELVCLVAYLYPRTAVFGAVLFSGYLGGATATHLRLEQPLFSHVLFPTYVGLLLWTGLLLRDPRLRAFLPFRSGHA
jgi:hypothetical protein